MTIDAMQSLLIRTLAAVDALFRPHRDDRHASWAAYGVMRARYRHSGVPHRGEGSQEVKRALDKAVGAGLIVRSRAATKTTGVVLTEAGLRAAWRIMGIPSDNAWEVTNKVAWLGRGGGWVSETAFTGGVGFGDGREQELVVVEILHAPALAAGWIESNATVGGHVAYRSTAAGMKALETPPGPSDEPPDPSPEIHDEYNRAFRESQATYRSKSVLDIDARGEIGPIPLSMSVFDRKAGKALR